MFISCYLLFHNNPYQQHVYLTSANAISASVYNGTSSITSYFNLRDINEDLQERNALLELEVISLRNQVNDLRLAIPDSTTIPDDMQHIDFILARVISNSISSPHNYITINRGSKHGIKPEMGIVDQNGVVGVVTVVSDHYSRVISMLNPNFRLSCKLRGTETPGSLVWDGIDPTRAMLEELPKQTRFHKGDTVVTSGFSSVFPEGIPVGVVEYRARGNDDNFFTLRVRLLSDFTSLSTVKVISNTALAEIRSVETDPETSSGN